MQQTKRPKFKMELKSFAPNPTGVSTDVETKPAPLDIYTWEMLIFTCINGQNISPVCKERQTESTQIICRLTKNFTDTHSWNFIFQL